jgi:two-component system response regulator BaeR
MRALAVEDDPRILRDVTAALTAAGFHVQTTRDGEEAWFLGDTEDYDLVVLDLGLPKMDGLDVTRALRQHSSVPIIMLTARVEEADRLLGLDLGADDYICKTPFSPREVVARVKALLRRSQSQAQTLVSALKIDDDGYQAWYLGQPLGLTPIEFRLLKALASAPGRVFSRDALLEKLHAEQRPVTDRAVDSHIKNLRRKLEQANADPECIRAIYGVGYRFDG